MIGRLRGVVVHKQPPQLLLDVNGVGYEVHAPMTTFYDVPETGQTVTLYTHLIVREDAHLLFGFSRGEDREVFRQLIKVTGIGAKTAVSILSGLASADLARCVAEGDVDRLTRVPGIGRKTAERMIIELRDKLNDVLSGLGNSGLLAPADGANNTNNAAPDPVADAVSALIALGYKALDASRWVRGIQTQGMRSEEIIRQALQQAAR